MSHAFALIAGAILSLILVKASAQEPQWLLLLFPVGVASLLAWAAEYSRR